MERQPLNPAQHRSSPLSGPPHRAAVSMRGIGVETQRVNMRDAREVNEGTSKSYVEMRCSASLQLWLEKTCRFDLDRVIKASARKTQAAQ